MLMVPAIKITASPKCFGGSEETLASLWGSGGARYGARGRDVWEEWGFIGHHIALSPRIDHERVDRESTVKMGPSYLHRRLDTVRTILYSAVDDGT